MAAGTTIHSGLTGSATRPLSFAKANDGALYFLNGIDLPQRYDGVRSQSYRWGIVAPASLPTIDDETGGGASAGDYTFGYRYVSFDETPTYSAMSPFAVDTASGSEAWNYEDLLASDNPRVKFVEIWRTTSGQSTTMYFIMRLGHGAGTNHAANISTATNNGSGAWRITCTEPHFLVNGSIVTVSGITGGTGHNGADQEVAVISDTVFDLVGTTYDSDGAGGKWVIAGWGTSTYKDILTDTQLNAVAGTKGVIASSVTGVTYSGKTRFTATAAHGLQVGSRLVIAGHSVGKYNKREHTILAVPSSTTFETDVDYDGSNGADGTWRLVNTADTILLEGGLENIRRQLPPVDFKSATVPFQDRVWVGVDQQYNTGTVSGSAASKTVTGSGTSWTAQMAGRYFYPAGAVRGYLINKASSTSLTLDEPLAAAISSSTLYNIRPAPSVEHEFYYSEVDEPESFPAHNVVKVQLRTDDDDRWTAMAPYGREMLLFRQRTTYDMFYANQPNIDATINLLSYRGCLNHRCWAVAEGSMYVMDALGPYRLVGTGLDDIGDPVRDYFRDNLIDFTKAAWFHVHADAAEGVVRFFVSLSSDSDARPGTALCYSYRTNAWWTEPYPWEIGGAASMDIAQRTRRLMGGENDVVYVANEGSLDATSGTGTAVRGTIATAWTTTTIALPANAPADCDGSTISVVHGTGKRQTRLIVSGQGTSSLTINAAFSPTAVVGDKYQIGGVPWRLRTGRMALSVPGRTKPSHDDRYEQRESTVQFKPTSAETLCDIRVYYNENATPEPQRVGSKSGSVGVTVGSGDNTSAYFNLASDANPNAASVGYVRFNFGGTAEHWADGDNDVSIELRGYQGESPVVLRSMSVAGVSD